MEKTWFVITLLALDAVTRLFVGLRVILQRQPVPASLAWLLLLLFVPFFSPFLYFLIGEHRLGTRRAVKLEKLTKQRGLQALELWRVRAVEQMDAGSAFRSVSSLCTAVTGFVPVGGNHLELMDDANLVIKRLCEDIANAKDHCHLLYYIWQPSGGGERVGEALIAAAKRGVVCRVLADGVGSKKYFKSALYERMLDAGVHVVAALDVNPLRMLFARVDLRNHRKVAVIDGTIGYCGSQNLTDETYRASKRRHVMPWIDTTARIEGPAVQPLQNIFLKDWECDSEEDLPDLNRFFPPPLRTGGKSIVQVVPSGPGPQPDTIHQALLSMLYSAKHEIIMTTPYFVPDEATKAALVNAALRGVKVTLVLPELLDMQVVAAASRSHYLDLLEAGITIMHHLDGLLHAKTATIDGELALVTSANLDMRSFWLNFEVSMFVYDDEFTGLLRQLQIKYIHESEHVHLDEWRNRPMIKRFLDNSARLFGPLL